MASQDEMEDEIQDLESEISALKFDLTTARNQRDNANTRLNRIAEVYQSLVDATASFEQQNIGPNTAYLLGAMAQGKTCEWSESRRADHTWIKLLRTTFPEDHFVWTFVTILDKDYNRIFRRGARVRVKAGAPHHAGREATVHDYGTGPSEGTVMLMVESSTPEYQSRSIIAVSNGDIEQA
jgi:hypothetical protein